MSFIYTTQLYPPQTHSFDTPSSNFKLTNHYVKVKFDLLFSPPFLYSLAVYEADNCSALLQFLRERAPCVWLKFDVFINWSGGQVWLFFLLYFLLK